MPACTSRTARGQTAYHAGASAEEAVLRAYLDRGLSLAAQRWRGTSGELDIVLRDGAGVVFVEVKKSRSFAQAAGSLSHRQIARIFGAASEFLAYEPQGLLTPARFDLALVDATGAVEIHENAMMS